MPHGGTHPSDNRGLGHRAFPGRFQRPRRPVSEAAEAGTTPVELAADGSGKGRACFFPRLDCFPTNNLRQVIDSHSTHDLDVCQCPFCTYIMMHIFQRSFVRHDVLGFLWTEQIRLSGYFRADIGSWSVRSIRLIVLREGEPYNLPDLLVGFARLGGVQSF